jgi:2-amino-4-hydroxy-6-hydroxymethyldihydropteridine diphosphokinase
MEHIVFLALGSNLGNRTANLKAALSNLPPQLILKNKSSVYETPPWGHEDQPPFLNQVVSAETYLKPLSLLRHLKRLEKALGRVPSFDKGPRLIDIDILFFDDVVMDTPRLVLPHPRLHERGFVLVPLAEIAPEFMHPALKKSVKQLLAGVDRKGIKVLKEKS